MPPPPPELWCDPLVCVVTGLWWWRPPWDPWCEPLVCVTTGVECEPEPELGMEVDAPLDAVVTGEEEEDEGA